MMKRAMSTVLLLMLCLGAASPSGAGEKLRVVATLFPQYDFARAIGGDRVEASLLLPPGVDSHAFEPKPMDMVKMAQADLFIHPGEEMEPWAVKFLAAANTGKTVGVDTAEGIALLAGDEADGDDDHGEDHDGGHGGGHRHHRLDPHFWLDPNLAMVMAGTIASAMAEADPANADYFRHNAAALADRLAALDGEARALVAGAKRRVLVFGGRFAFAYFCRRYGLDHVGAYDYCGPGADPSLHRIVAVAEFIRANGIPAIYYEEMSQPRIAKTLADETGAALFMAHSLHNLSAEETAAGLDYFAVMRRNLDAFRKGLE